MYDLIFMRENARSERTVPPRAPETPRAPGGLVEILHFLHLGHDNFLEDELSDAVAPFNFEIRLGVVEEDDADGTAVIVVDHAGTGIDELLEGQARAGGDAGVGAPRDGDREVRLDQAFAAGGDDRIVGRREVVSWRRWSSGGKRVCGGGWGGRWAGGCVNTQHA